MTRSCSSFCDRLMRRKRIADDKLEDTKLSRCLSLIDLIAIGIGATLGAGAYVLAGQVAKRDAGPAVVISFLIAAVTSILSGLCYAEFGARVPKAGSAYLYTYVTVGEFMAFVIGWNLILEYVIGTAGVARTATGYLDALFGDKLVDWFSTYLSMHTQQFAPYADLLAFGITMLLTAILSIGVKESAMVTKVFTGLNLFVLGYVVVMGCFHDDPHNWNLSTAEVPDQPCGHNDNSTFCGDGGFAPYGLPGIIKGAATCFFAFVGFDAIATTGEEAKNPQRNIPLATIISLLVVFAVYFSISLTITMMSPYYALDMKAPFAIVFKRVGWNISAYIVSVGAIFALATSMIGGMFPMPRVIFSMASDGLLFRFLARIDPRAKTPVLATVVSGTLAAVMGMLFEVDALVEMLSVGTLLAYTLVAASVIILRYDVDQTAQDDLQSGPVSLITIITNPTMVICPRSTPDQFTAAVVKYLTFILGLLTLSIGLLVHFAASKLFLHGDWLLVSVLVFLIILSISAMFLISRQPESDVKLTFKTPFVPFLPVISILANVYLMINLTPFTWVRFAVWMTVGFIIYFGYGIRHSTEQALSRKYYNDLNQSAKGITNGDVFQSNQSNYTCHL